MLVVFLVYMSFGITVWYNFTWQLTTRGETILTATAQFQTMAIIGFCTSFLAGALVAKIDAQYILAIGAGSVGVTSILMATMPAQQTWWRTLFPAYIFLAFCPDFTFTAAQILAINAVKLHEQGVAGSLIGTILTWGISTGMGIGGTVEVHTNRGGRDPVRGYRGACYLAFGLAVAAVAVSLLKVRIVKDVREGWGEDGAPPALSVAPEDRVEVAGIEAPAEVTDGREQAGAKDQTNGLADS